MFVGGVGFAVAFVDGVDDFIEAFVDGVGVVLALVFVGFTISVGVGVGFFRGFRFFFGCVGQGFAHEAVVVDDGDGVAFAFGDAVVFGDAA